MKETFTRMVLGPNGMTQKTFTREVPTPSKSPVENTVTPTENEQGQSTENSTPVNTDGPAVITVDLIRAMEPQELRVLAKENDLKIGNVKDKVKMQDKVIKLLKLEDESEAL